MTSLLEEIRGISDALATKLETAEYCTDAKIKSLNRQDLLELFPGDHNLKVRKKVHEEICSRPATHQQDSINAVLLTLKGFIPDESFRAPLSNNGPLLHYLCILEKLRDDLINVQNFFDAHINLLKGIRLKLDEKTIDDLSVETALTSGNHAPAGAEAAPVAGFTQTVFSTINRLLSNRPSTESARANDSCNQSMQKNNSSPGLVRLATVTYKMHVCGNTLDTHLEVLKKVNGAVPGHSDFLQLQEAKHSEESQVIIVFCPVVSRVGTDVEAALSGISRDKPIILVVMHHLHTPRSFPKPGPYNNVVLGVHVFFHDTAKGLLRGTENNEAIREIKTKLLEYSTKKSRNNS